MSDWKYWLKKSGLVRTQRNNETGFLRKRFTNQVLILIDLVDVDKVRVHRSGFLQLTMRDLKKQKIITHLIDRSSLLSYFTLAGLVIFIKWSQITFLLSIRRTGSQQIDFKDLDLLKVENILETNFINFRKSITIEINNKYFR